MEQQVLNLTLGKMIAEQQVLDRIVAKQVFEIIVDELLEKELQPVTYSVIVDQLVHHKNVVVQEMGSIVVKQMVVMDNIESGLSKMENWQLKQFDLDTFVFLNELYFHELHVSLDVHSSDQSQWYACLLLI
uniref:Uncharacterized protein n=1 Tax=Tanacetum cinerariifolium TaxID=118510 RepID=A0A699JGW9_TANCI|nr:hypothetical protein [Tanacetum cinerariifolium]